MKGGEAGAPRAVGGPGLGSGCRAEGRERIPGPWLGRQGCCRLTRLAPLFPSPGPARAGGRLARARAQGGPPLPFRRVCCLARPGTTRRASGVPGAAPGRPAVLPGGLLTGTEACCFSSRTSPSSETQVANLAGFGAGKPECGACASPCGVSAGPRVLGHLCWSPPLVTTGTCLWIQTPAAWLRGTQS